MLKKIWKCKFSRVWMLVTIPVIVLFLVVTILATGVKDFYELFNTVMPGGGLRAIYAEGIEPTYPSKYTTKAEVYAAARDVNEKICEEGMVLLKNKNNTLPLKTSVSDDSVTGDVKISIFGKNSVNIAYGGSGSGGANTSNVIDLYQGLEAAGYVTNPTLKSFYNDASQSGESRKGNSSDLDSGDTVILSTAETPQDKYTAAVKNSYSEYNDAAIVVFTRIGGEGFDIPRKMTGATGYRNEDDHFLQLDRNEEDLLAAVCEAGFEKVIVLVNSGQAMELGFLKEGCDYVTEKGYSIDPSKIDAAMWMGFPGETGTLAVGNILNGTVNPSGKLADTYYTDFKKDPTWFNFGDNRLTRTGRYLQSGYVPGGDEYVFDVADDDQPEMPYYFVDYEEGVYVGYKYYETRGVTDGEEWYDKNVVYPFGYGLSYTEFEWELTDKSLIENRAVSKTEKYSVQVKVTNTGDVAGKDIVQLYGHAPYTPGGIEKPEVSLLDFAKTDLLQPGESDTLTLTFDPYYLASYDYKDKNGNGNKGYELEDGNYALYLSKTAHDVEFKVPFTVASDILYDKDTVTGENDVKNRYTDCENPAFNSDTSLETVLSRNDWEGTFPAAPTADERKGNAELLGWLKDKRHNNPTDFSDFEMPVSEEDNGLTLRDLLYDEDGNFVGAGDGTPLVDYDDERWDSLIDQVSVADMINVYDYASYRIAPVEKIELPLINCADGPVGWACFMDKTRFYDTCSYCSETLIATSWNKQVARMFGEMVGDEGIIGNQKGDGAPYTSWYAPGVNIHRSPFGGRNFEYYSEDGVLSGAMAAQQVGGCNARGVFTMIKHFAVNEQETHRSISGDCSWLTEQSMREIYLRPFEIAVKDGGTRGLMSSFNRIGTRWAGGDYRLLTEILRDEWGFKGTVLCDFNTIPAYMNSRQMAYAGGDLNLATGPETWCDESSVADVVVIRRCFKNTVYTIVNSNAMNGKVIGYNMPIWQIFLIVFDVLLVVGLGVWGFFAIRGALKKDKERLATKDVAVCTGNSGDAEIAPDSEVSEKADDSEDKTSG